jgi:hypothetical protein
MPKQIICWTKFVIEEEEEEEDEEEDLDDQ